VIVIALLTRVFHDAKVPQDPDWGRVASNSAEREKDRRTECQMGCKN
jgi:hypothetical protein